MRLVFAILFVCVVAALGVCAALARRSRKSIGASLALMLWALIPPVTGNLIIICSGVKAVSHVGCYIYFLGMDMVMFALLKFTFDYCHITWPNANLKRAVYGLLALDAAQLLCNPLFGHAFDTERIVVDGFAYYRLIPYYGQAFHRLVDYGILASVIVIFIVKVVQAPRIYSERYTVILFTMILGGVWQTYYIFSRTPVDRSMLGFGAFGLLVFYFALYYRPMRLLDRMLAGIASELPEALFFFDASGRCIWANRPGMELTRVERKDFDQATERLEGIFGALDVKRGDWSDKRVLGAGDGVKHYALEARMVTDDRDRVAGSFLSVRDETQEQRALERERYNARHDGLTGLYTREYLYERIHEKLLADPGGRFLIVFVDVKDFKIVNDIFGSAFGDCALRRVAEWVARAMSADCVYGRLAGDTFGACLSEAEFDARRIEEQLSRFVVRDGALEHPILIHLGVYRVAEPGLEVSVMFDRAHMALATIKDKYQTHIAYYDGDMRDRVLWNQLISAQMREALNQRQICPYLQPIVDAAGKVVGAEELVRWNHPVHGLLTPAQFVPVLEKNGMIAEMDRYMWRCACETLRRWQTDCPGLFISVNISPNDFYFMDVAAEIKGAVRDFGVDPALLRIEITETVMMADIENRMRILGELRQAGFVVEIDDFGSGYSSFNLLRQMPVDVLKIDMLFLNKSKDDEKARTILRNIIDMSRDLGIVTVTEGVETADQIRMLSEMGCSLFQGYYFAEPLPVEEFERYCATNRDGEDKPGEGKP